MAGQFASGRAKREAKAKKANGVSAKSNKFDSLRTKRFIPCFFCAQTEQQQQGWAE